LRRETNVSSGIALQIDGLTKSYGDVVAVDDLSLVVRRGEIFGILGPNGSGKTTTVKMMLGMLDPDGGSIRVNGIDPVVDSRAVKARLGYVSEEAVLYSSMNARDIFELVASVRGIEQVVAVERTRRYLASFGVTDLLEKPMGTMSRGQKQKIEIIAALLHRPDLLILDEPLSGLDAKSVRVFKEILNLHTERGGAVLFSTHILEVAEELCDRICVIAKGKHVASGTPAELRSASRGGGDRLEDVFLRLTEEDSDIEDIVAELRTEKS
jgi:ABC-2 type transport system ATP-binding protein